MEITICENLKSFRKTKGNTQEELADFLSISIQAVSKWERGEGYPDITLLPKISAYYNTTVDELLGITEIRKKERIDEILKQNAFNSQNGLAEENVKLMREAYNEFPNDFNIIEYLMHALFFTTKDEYLDEVITLGEKIISECTVDDTRYSALQTLCYSYARKNKIDKAKEYAFKLPYYSSTLNQVLISVLKGEELLKYTQGNIQLLVDNIYLNINCMLNAKSFTTTEKIHAYVESIQFYKLLFENGDFGFYHCRLSDLYRNIAREYALLSDKSNTILNLKLALQHAIQYDELPDGLYTSPLVNATAHLKSHTSKNWQGTQTKLFSNCIEWNSFDFLRDTDEFKAFLTELDEAVKNEEARLVDAQ